MSVCDNAGSAVTAVLRAAAILVCAGLACARPAPGQELEPRSYAATPVGTNIANGIYTFSKGSVSLDPSLPLSDVRASIDTVSLSFNHTFRVGGRAGAWAVIVPYLGGHVSAAVYGQEQAATRYGFPDARVRLSFNFIGPALAPSEFARRKPGTSAGISCSVIVPTGTYSPVHLINIGSNRWSVKPEIGIEQPMGKWFVDLSAGMWFFGTNANYYGARTQTQDPLGIYQMHSGYNFHPGQWLALDADYYTGGATTVSGAGAINRLANSRYGVTFAQPAGGGLTAKLSWSHWLSGQYGQNFSTIGAALQYRWFDRF